jgi:hypothetical protein
MIDKFEELRKQQESPEEVEYTEEKKKIEKELSNLPEDEPVKPMDNALKRANILNIILLVMVFMMIGLFAYLYFTDRIVMGKDSLPLDSEVAQDSELTEGDTEEEIVEDKDVEKGYVPEDSEGESEVVTSKEYFNNSIGVKFTYPSNWVVLSEEYDESMMTLSLKLADKMIEPQAVFQYSIPAVFSSEVCNYTNTDYIDLENGAYRRSLDEVANIYVVCKSDSTGYTEWMDPGKITYVVDNQRADLLDVLKTLDSITLSFEYEAI